MTTSFPPPTGAPVATVAPAPARTPAGQGQPARATAKTPGTRRFLIPSATLFRVLRLLAALACVAAGVIGTWTLTTGSGSIDDIRAGTQQVLRLQQIKGEILRADGLATNGLAQGASEPVAQREQYRQALQRAAQMTVEAARSQAADQADLSSVNAGLVTYASTLEMARTTYPANNAGGLSLATQADQTLRSEAIPALDRLIASNQARIDAARGTDPLWVIGLALVPVILLLGISVWLARRTKRVLNIGLVLALAASVGLWRLVDVTVTNSVDAVEAGRAGALQTATAAGQAFSALADAKSLEGRELLQPANLAGYETKWTAAMADVDAQVKKLGSQSAAAATKVAAYRTAHEANAALLKANQVTKARTEAANATSGVNPTYAGAADTLSQVFGDAQKQADAKMADQGRDLNNAAILALLLGIAGALAAWIGIGQRLGEYR